MPGKWATKWQARFEVSKYKQMLHIGTSHTPNVKGAGSELVGAKQERGLGIAVESGMKTLSHCAMVVKLKGQRSW